MTFWVRLGLELHFSDRSGAFWGKITGLRDIADQLVATRTPRKFLRALFFVSTASKMTLLEGATLDLGVCGTVWAKAERVRSCG